MTKNLRILIVGFGSIGARHYQNLTALGYAPVIFDPLIKEHSTPQNFSNFDVALICTPTHLHISSAIEAARAGCHVFVEKPLSHNIDGLNELEAIVEEKKLITMVGCNMRFHPCLSFIKSYLAQGSLGQVYRITLEYGQNLEYWRPGQDYRKNYAAKKETGGGIILDDIHEFDLLFWLNDFKKVIDSSVLSSHASDLHIETEDQAVGTFLFENRVLGTVSCDYLSERYHRTARIVGENGNLTWDFLTNKVNLETKDAVTELFSVKKYDPNQMYIEELKYFLDCVNSKTPTSNDITTARKVLASILKK